MTGPSSAGSKPTCSSRSARHAALPARSPARERCGEIAVRGRIPDRVVQPVEDPDEPIPAAPQQAVQAHPELRCQRLPCVARRDGVDDLGRLDPGGEQVHAVRVLPRHPGVRPQPELGQRRVVGPAVIGEVVQRRDHGRARHDGIIRVPQVPEDRGGAGLPVVEVQDVERTVVHPQGLHRGSAVQPEPPGVVRIVPRSVAVEALAIECRRVVDEPQAIPVRGHVHDRHGRRARPRPRIRHGQRRLAQDVARIRVRNAAIARQEHVDRTVDAVDLRVTQRPRQRIHHVRQATGLRPRLTLGGQERHAQSHRGPW